MSEKIIVLHPENQPEVDIYPIIKEGSIPNSVIDNQKIKSRTIINSNIALNTLKYEVLHSTLKQLIDSKITQVNMENYLTSYYYNVEETQQYVGSEINTLHQTIQNEFYSNTTIDNMLMEKTDLSLFRQYLPSNYLNLVKQEDNQTSNLHLYATGNIFLNNFGNKNNATNYYLPNSLTKVEDAEHDYYVLSTTNDDYQSLYNLGAYDKITTNDDGRYTITRQTGYIDLGKLHWIYDPNNKQFYSNEIDNAYSENSNWTSVVCNTYTYNIVDYNDLHTPHIRGFFDKRLYLIDETLNQNGELITGVIQYKLATAITEKVEKNHYERYNQRFILEHNKSEAERSCNFWYKGDVTFGGEYPEIFKKCKKGIHTLRISSTRNTSYGEFHWYIRDLTTDTLILDGILPNNSYTLNVTQEMIDHDVRMWSWGTTSSDVCKAMLNEGSTPLPYQPYEGETIHEKDLENTKNEINNAKQDKLVSGTNIKTINGNSILGSGNITVTADSLFSQVTDVVDTFTINKNGTWLITCLGYDKIYASDNSNIDFYGSALVSMTGAESNPHICINGIAFSCNSTITFITSGIMQVYKKAN